MLRSLLFFVVLIGAGILPFAVSKLKNHGIELPFVSGEKPNEDESAKPTLGDPSLRPIDPKIHELLKPPVAGDQRTLVPIITPLPDALRFDLTQEYVTQRWPRVSTQLAELDLHGFRVPLVTGDRPEDFHGSVTYFFNSSGIVDRIEMRGFVTEIDYLTNFVQNTFRLRAYAATGRKLYLSYLNGQPLSMMQVTTSGVVANDRKRSQYEVTLELNRPKKGATLSSSSMETLRSLRQASML